jgi:hypothetical protein
MKTVLPKRLLLALMIAATGGCASVPRGDPEQDGALKTFAVHPLRSGVFIYRDASKVGPATTTVEINGRPIGFTPPASYLYVQLPTGKYTVAARADGIVDAIDIHAEQGKLIYIRQEVKPGSSFSWRGGVAGTPIKLHVVDEVEGRLGVRAASLAENPIQPARRVQTIEVRLEADAPATQAPMECVAANDVGHWTFVAPGTVQVRVSDLALEVICKPSDGRHADSLVVVPRSRSAEGAKSDATTGALVGGVIGVGLGVAAAPVMGPAIGAAIAAGSAWRGAEIGTIVGWVTAGDYSYPAVLSVKVKAQRAD